MSKVEQLELMWLNKCLELKLEIEVQESLNINPTRKAKIKELKLRYEKTVHVYMAIWAGDIELLKSQIY